jgi:hypothetical protein
MKEFSMTHYQPFVYKNLSLKTQHFRVQQQRQRQQQQQQQQ